MKFDSTDLSYVVSVLKGTVGSCVCDGDLEPPKGAKCKTRAGFRSWLRRYNRNRAANEVYTTNNSNPALAETGEKR